MKTKKEILEEEWNKGSDTNQKRLARYRLLCETYASNCMNKYILELIENRLKEVGLKLAGLEDELENIDDEDRDMQNKTIKEGRIRIDELRKLKDEIHTL